MNNPNDEFLKIPGKILLRCWIFGFLFLLLWFGAFMNGVVHNLHGLAGLSQGDMSFWMIATATQVMTVVGSLLVVRSCGYRLVPSRRVVASGYQDP